MRSLYAYILGNLALHDLRRLFIFFHTIKQKFTCFYIFHMYFPHDFTCEIDFIKDGSYDFHRFFHFAPWYFNHQFILSLRYPTWDWLIDLDQFTLVWRKPVQTILNKLGKWDLGTRYWDWFRLVSEHPLCKIPAKNDKEVNKRNKRWNTSVVAFVDHEI